MKKTLLLLPLLPLALSGCGLIEKSVQRSTKNPPNQITVLYEEGKPNSFGECSQLKISVQSDKGGEWLIKGEDGTGVKELILHKEDVKGQKVYTAVDSQYNEKTFYDEQASLIVICDDKVNEAHEFSFTYHSHNSPRLRTTLYRASTIPDWEEWLKSTNDSVYSEKNGLKSFILISHR